jgi:hypothetical protein
MPDDELIARLLQVGEEVCVPCPDGIKGCLVNHFGIVTDPVVIEAATRLETLTAENERLREALEKIAGVKTVKFDGSEPFHNIEIAIAALKQGDQNDG